MQHKCPVKFFNIQYNSLVLCFIVNFLLKHTDRLGFLLYDYIASFYLAVCALSEYTVIPWNKYSLYFYLYSLSHEKLSHLFKRTNSDH